MEILQAYFPSLLVFILFIICLFVYYSHNNLNYWKNRGVYQLDDTHTIFGDFKNAILFRTAPGYHLGEIYRKAPPDVPFVGFYIFHKPCLLIKDPEIVKQVLVRDFNNFSDRHFAGPQQKDSIGMINLFGVKNPTWKYLRSMISPTLTSKKLRDMFPLMIDTAKPMMDYIEKNIDNVKTHDIDVQNINHRFTADLIANIALGTKTDSFNDFDSYYTQCLMGFFHSFKRMVALVTVFFVPELVDWIGSPLLFDSTFVRKLFWSAVESREKSGEKRGDYIDSIIQLKSGEQNPLYKFEGDNLLYQSGTFFSGFESSSTAAAFTLMELAKNKKFQNRARDEIRHAVDRHGWSIQTFKEMKFLDQCVAEGIRLHPSISTIDRCTLQNYKIPNTDIVIEKGTPIYVSLYGLHGDPQYFRDPNTFDPERFSEGKDVSDAYIPFGNGPRKCVGMKVGEMHVKVILALILSEYELHHPESAVELDPRSTFTAAADGISIKFTKLNEQYS